MIQAGTALSVRRRGEPNAFNRIDISRDGRLEVRRVAWDGARWIADDAPMARLTRSRTTDTAG